jgi:hypothetical protein
MSHLTVDRFTADIQQLKLNFPELDSVAYYVAGAAKQNLQFDLNVEIILRFLGEVIQAVHSDEITADQRTDIEFSIYRGVIGEARQKLTAYKSAGRPPPLFKQKSSQLDFLESKILRSSFSEVEEIDGVRFMKNPETGELVSEAEAERIEKANHDLIRKLNEADFAESRRLVDDDERLARALQEQFNQEEKPVEADVTCKICLEAIPEAEFLPLENCGDLFHKLCIAQCLNTLINDRQFPLVCPLPECRMEINMIDISERLEPADFARFEEFAFNHFVQRNMEDMTCCPTPDCSYVFSKQGQITMFVCPVCKHEYCLQCKCSYHGGKSCEDYQRDKLYDPSDQAFIEFAKGAKYKTCARCKFWVEKSEGCDHMTCRCGYEFCYVCGGVYMQCACQAGLRRPMMMRGLRRPVMMPGRLVPQEVLVRPPFK